MKLMRKNDLGLMKTEQKLQVSEKRITMKPKNTKTFSKCKRKKAMG